MNKRGFEMATSTLVVMILGVLILGGGIVLLRQLTSSADDAVLKLSTNQMSALNNMLSQGQLVAAYPSNQVVKAGKTAVFGIGILNKLDTDTTFSIHYTVTDPQGADITAQPTLLVRRLPTVDVPVNERRESVIGVTPKNDAPQGTYTILVNITSGSPEVTYDSVRFFTVRVQ